MRILCGKLSPNKNIYCSLFLNPIIWNICYLSEQRCSKLNTRKVGVCGTSILVYLCVLILFLFHIYQFLMQFSFEVAVIYIFCSGGCGGWSSCLWSSMLLLIYFSLSDLIYFSRIFWLASSPLLLTLLYVNLFFCNTPIFLLQFLQGGFQNIRSCNWNSMRLRYHCCWMEKINTQSAGFALG